MEKGFKGSHGSLTWGQKIRKSDEFEKKASWKEAGQQNRLRKKIKPEEVLLKGFLEMPAAYY